jgi:hypothetical protein
MNEMKRVGVIGPTNPSLIESKLGLAEGTFEGAAKEIGSFLAKNSFALASIPVRGVNLWAFEAYIEEGGPDSLAFTPSAKEQPQEAIDQLRTRASKADSVRDDLTWGEAPFELAKASDYFVAIGISCGTLIEMACTKWFDGPPIFMVSSYVSQIPTEMLAEIDVRFCESIEALKEALISEGTGSK